MYATPCCTWFTHIDVKAKLTQFIAYITIDSLLLQNYKQKIAAGTRTAGNTQNSDTADQKTITEWGSRI